MERVCETRYKNTGAKLYDRKLFKNNHEKIGC
jgi:hypothetical protein